MRFGRTGDGREVSLYTLRNRTGAEARITDYGGIVVSLRVPDRDGNLGDVVLGFDALDQYLDDQPHFGCIAGRYANRIAKGTFALNGTTYALATNHGPNHLHGGLKGFDKVLWDARTMDTEDGPALELAYLSPDGEEGYPGNLAVTAAYTLTHDNTLRLDLSANTDQPTVVNLTNHAYFNLSGATEEDILDHEIEICADRYLPVDEGLIPTGELAPVAGTPFDFRAPHRIGGRIDEEDVQLARAGGYDHNWVLTKDQDGALAMAARVRCDRTGRILEAWTTEPGLQFYSGNFLDGTLAGREGAPYAFRAGFCLEPQRYPDTPNQPAFPTATLRPDETYRHTIEYRFSTDR